MNRRNSILGTSLGLLASAGLVTPAQSQPRTLAESGVTIVVPFVPVAGKNRDDIVKAMKNVAAVISRQPGVIDGALMEARSPGNNPAFVHVARWRERKHWDALFSNPEVIQVMKANAGFFRLDAAGVYIPVEP
mgnify:CR=1 FL=1